MSSGLDERVPAAAEGGSALALDVGDARIGLATGALGSSLAFGRGALTREGTKRDVPAVLKAAEREGASVIVIGLPLRLDGAESAQTERVRRFASALAEGAAARGISVALEDERFTTRIASRQVSSSALPRGKREEKGRLDEAAAVLILESYLERFNAAKRGEQGEESR